MKNVRGMMKMKMNLNTMLYLVTIALMLVLIGEMKRHNDRSAELQADIKDVLTMTTSMFTQGRVGMEVK